MKVKQNLSKEKNINILKRTPKSIKKINAALPKLRKQAKEIKKGVNVAKASLVSLDNKLTTDNILDIPSKLVEQSVKIVFDLHNEYKKNIKVLPVNNRDYVYLQVVWMKKPEVPEKRRKYLKLHHGLFGDDPEVCLFVRDWIIHDHAKRTPDEKIEASIAYYEEYLKTHEIEGISTIMPAFQFKTEYSGYELQRKLVDRFDLFLCQASLTETGSFLNKLGIAFNKKNKVPLTLKFPNDAKNKNEKFKTKVSTLLRTTWYQMKPHGDTASIRIGSLEHTPEQIKENLIFVLNQLKAKDAIPGGTENVRSIMLKTSRSKAIPLFMNLASPAKIPTPKVKSLRPVHDAVEGELSTLPGKKVTVLPSGDVFVVDDSEDEYHSDSDEEIVKSVQEADQDDSSEEDKPLKKEVKKPVKKGKKVVKKKVKADENFSEDSDDDVDNAEQQYLSSWNNEANDEETDNNSNDDEEEVETKKSPNVKKSKKKAAAKPIAKVAKSGKRKGENQEENQGTKKAKKLNEKKITGNAVKKPKQKQAGPSKNNQPAKRPQIIKGKKASKK